MVTPTEGPLTQYNHVSATRTALTTTRQVTKGDTKKSTETLEVPVP